MEKFLTAYGAEFKNLGKDWLLYVFIFLIIFGQETFTARMLYFCALLFLLPMARMKWKRKCWWKSAKQ